MHIMSLYSIHDCVGGGVTGNVILTLFIYHHVYIASPPTRFLTYIDVHYSILYFTQTQTTVAQVHYIVLCTLIPRMITII